MKTYRCSCGNRLFFENTLCVVCQTSVGWCSECHNVVPLIGESPVWTCGNPLCQASLVPCYNRSQHEVCNRCVTVSRSEVQPLCDSCRFNDVIPDLSVAGNQQKWYRLEAAKRQLIYLLDLLQLPYGDASDGFSPPLSFDFKADVMPANSLWRTMGPLERVYTGHSDGKITINVAEADDLEREKRRVDLNESHRTLIGHFRHEIGHYYWDVLVKNGNEESFRALFGNENDPAYSEALDRYYREGPASDWGTRHISAYASMHPWEDFAETFSFYLDMVAVLDTARHFGLSPNISPTDTEIKKMLVAFGEVGIILNEFNRAMGLLDLAPEIIVPAVVEKLEWIHQLVNRNSGDTVVTLGRPSALADGVSPMALS